MPVEAFKEARMSDRQNLIAELGPRWMSGAEPSDSYFTKVRNAASAQPPTVLQWLLQSLANIITPRYGRRGSKLQEKTD
jgi:hypothetical protein